MEYTIEKLEFESYSKLTNIHGKIYYPLNKKIKGIIQIVHGMSEYFDRYLETIEYFLENGYIVCGHDHLGHGDSYRVKEERGYFGEENGYKALVRDTHTVTKFVKNKYPGFKFYIIGHSMGSFITRVVVSKYNKDYDGVVFLGTGGPNALTQTGIDLAKKIARKRGGLYRSPLILNTADKMFNAGIQNPKTVYDWLSRDEEVIRKRMKDKKSDFKFSTQGYVDLLTLNKLANDPKILNKMDKKFHIALFSGDKDPVGTNGKTVVKLYELLEENDFENVQIKLYKDCRHELLNELNKEKVRKDILKYLEKVDRDLEVEKKVSVKLEEYVIPLILEKYNLDIKENFAVLLEIVSNKEKEYYAENDLQLLEIETEKSKNVIEKEVMRVLSRACEKRNNNLENTFLITNEKLNNMERAACFYCKVPVVYYLKETHKSKENEVRDYIAEEKGIFSLRENKYVDEI